MVYLFGLFLLAEGAVKRSATAGRKTRRRIGRLTELLRERWPRRDREDEIEDEPFLDENAMDAWLAPERDWREITDPTIPRYRDEPAESPQEPRREPTQPETWADANTRALATWELRAAEPTALVARRERPRDEIATHHESFVRESYLGSERTPDYKPRHAATELEDQDGPTADAGPARGQAAPVGAGEARRLAPRGRGRSAQGRGRQAGDRTRYVVRRREQVHGPADRPRRRSDDHLSA